jgi:hypothetical protein
VILPHSLMQLVYEKEKRLRMMMKMHGLGDVAYWLVMYSWFWMLYVAYMLIFVIFGSIIKLNMFTRNSYGEEGALDKGLLLCTVPYSAVVGSYFGLLVLAGTLRCV